MTSLADTKPALTIIDLIRHGEPVGGRKYRGQSDDPLSDKGWRQMREAVGDHQPWQAIVSSPLLRCAAFADELSHRHGLPLALDARLMEIGLGAWEGRTADELRREDPQQIRRFQTQPLDHPPPGAERLQDFRDRIVAAWADVLARHAGQHVLVVGHAGIIRMVVRHVLDMPLETLFRIHVPNAGITRVQVEHGFAQLIFHAGRL